MMSLRRALKQVKQVAITPSVMSTDNLHRLFEAQVIQHPHKTAIVCDEIKLTYLELNQKANQLAHYLKQAGVALNTLVAINLPRSSEIIISFLAVLKAGGAYIPIDTSCPASRLNFLLDDSHAAFLITHSTLLRNFTSKIAVPICIDLEKEKIATYSVINLDLPIALHDLAYVIYTSGSTGQPKGVAVEHRNIVNATTASFSAFSAEPITNLLLLLSVAFDGSFAGIYWTLCQGGKLVLPNEVLSLEPSHLNALIRDHKITDLICTPTLYRSCMEFITHHAQHLSRVMVGGEICTEQ
jgi:surfactin family lipopeptide synthetase A